MLRYLPLCEPSHAHSSAPTSPSLNFSNASPRTGCLQLNEVWPTGGWGSLEYGTVGFTAGQVLGGRWKPLHHMLERHLYRQQIAACGDDGRCFVRNDDPLVAFSGGLQASLWHLQTGQISPLTSFSVNLGPGSGAFWWGCLGAGSASNNSCVQLSTVISAAGCASNGSDCLLLLNLTSSDGTLADVNWQLLTAPGRFSSQLSVPDVSAAVTGRINPDGSAEVVVTSTGPALFVHLTTLAQGRFSDNAFHIPSAGSRTVTFIPFGPLQLDTLTSTLRLDQLLASLIHG